MSDIGNGNSQRDVDKIILEALKVWEECGFKDMSLWETFQEDFEGFTEQDFILASNYNIRRLRDYLRKFGVWIRKQKSLTIARSLYEALLEEQPTEWTEAEIMACKEKEEFASYQISWLLEFDFGRKPQLGVFKPTYPSGPRPAATSSAFPTLPTSAPVNAPTILPPTTLSLPAPTTPTDAGSIPTVGPIMNAASSVDPPITGHTPFGPPAAFTYFFSFFFLHILRLYATLWVMTDSNVPKYKISIQPGVMPLILVPFSRFLATFYLCKCQLNPSPSQTES